MQPKMSRLFAKTALVAGLFAAAAMPAQSANLNFNDLADSITVDAADFEFGVTTTHMSIFGGEDDVRVHGQFITNSADGSGDSWAGLVEPGVGCSVTQTDCYSDVMHVTWTVSGRIADLTVDFGSDPEALGHCAVCKGIFEDGTLQNVNGLLSLPDNITIQIQSDVPEPAMPALIGLSLLGLAAARRRRQ